MKKEWVEKFYSDGLLLEPYKEWQLDMLNSDAPVELFQYRSGEEINVTNLEKEVIWTSAVRNVNDPFDCDFNMSALNELEGKIPHDAIEQVRESTVNLRETLAISCFSERNDSILMWSHYANKHKGFCLCYAVRDILSAKKKLFPVWYREEKVLPICKGKTIQQNPRIREILIQKSPDWSYEKEWRIFELLDNTTDKGKTIKIKPLKIIIGACADEALKDTLRRIGKSKGIEVAQMHLKNEEFKLIEN